MVGPYEGLSLVDRNALGLGALTFLAGCVEDSGWNTGFMGSPMNSNATPSDSYR
jgi:hypothetical protein